MKTDPDRDVLVKAMATMRSVAHVIIMAPGLEVRSQGTGFVIRHQDSDQDNTEQPRSLLLTCHHVVKERNENDQVLVRKVTAGVVQELAAVVLEEDPNQDIALLGVLGLKSHTPRPLALTVAAPGNVDDCIAAVGHCDPNRLFTQPAFSRIPAISPGSIMWTAPAALHNGIVRMIVATDCVCTQGMSGSPLVDRRAAIGMVASISQDGSRAYAVSSDTILQVLRGWAGFDVHGNRTMEELLESLHY